MDNKNMNKNIKNLEKKEDKLQKQLNKCKKTKCSKLYKIKEKEQLIFEKEQDKQCPKTLTNDEFYKCSEKFYNDSEYKKIFDEYVKCGETKCKIYKKKLHTLRDKLLVYDMAKIAKMENKEKSKVSKKNMSGGMKKNLKTMSNNNLDKQQIKNMDAISKCSKKHCSIFLKEMQKEQKALDKKTKICPSFDDDFDGYQKCYDELYDKSNLQKKQDDNIKCKFTKCKKEYAIARALDKIKYKK